VMLAIIVLSIVGTAYSIYRRAAGNKSVAAVQPRGRSLAGSP
jgi:hypothetical protein